MAKKIKDKAAIAARKRDRKANELAFTGNFVPALKPIEVIPTKKIVAIGYNQYVRNTMYNGSKCPVTAELERTAIVVAQERAAYGANTQKYNFKSLAEFKDVLKDALKGESTRTLYALWNYLIDFETLPTLYRNFLESLEFAHSQLINNRISWWGVKVFFNNHYNLGIKVD